MPWYKRYGIYKEVITITLTLELTHRSASPCSSSCFWQPSATDRLDPLELASEHSSIAVPQPDCAFPALAPPPEAYAPRRRCGGTCASTSPLHSFESASERPFELRD